MENKKINKSTSYFEWAQSFKEKPNEDVKGSNSLGIPDEVLKAFLDIWKEKNL